MLPETFKALGVIEKNALADGDVLVYDGGRVKFVSMTPTLSLLSDVDLSSPTNGQVLTYHAASGTWKNAPPVILAADAAALYLLTPGFIGQLAMTLDSTFLLVAISTEVGEASWVAIGPYVVPGPG